VQRAKEEENAGVEITIGTESYA